MYKMYT